MLPQPESLDSRIDSEGKHEMEQQERSKRSLLRWLIFGMLSVLLLLCALFALLQLPVAKDQISSTVSKLLSSDPNQQIQIGKIEGFIPFRIRISEIHLSDAEGTWLQLDDLYFEWSPLKLLRGAVYVDEISASQIAVSRLPEGPAKETAQKKSEPFKLPTSLPNITIKDLAVADLSLGSELLGHSGSFALQGSVTQPEDSRGLRAALQIRRIDKGPLTLADLTALLDTRASHLRIDFDFEEEAGGWVATVAGLKDSPPLKLALHGNGPLDAWDGELEADAGQYGSLSTSLGLDAADDMKLILNGGYTPGTLVLSSQVKPLLTSGVHFAFEGRFKPEERASIEEATIEGTGFGVNINGSYDMKKERFATDFSLNFRDLSTLEGFVKTPLKGKLALQGSFAGPVREPRGKLTLNLQEAQAEGYRAGQVQTTLQMEPSGPLAPDFSGVKISAEGSAQQLEAVNGKPLPENSLHWALDGKVHAQQDITVSTFELTGDHLRLTLSGDYDLAKMKGKLDAQLNVSDLEPLTEFVDQRLPGTAALEAHLSGDGLSRSAAGEISGFLKPAAGFPSLPAAILGKKTTFATKFDLSDGSKVQVPTLKLESPVFRFDGQTSVDISANRVLANWQLSVPSLTPLEPAVGKPLSGGLQANGEIEGPLKSFKTTTTVEGEKVRFDKIDLQKILLNATARNLPEAPSGDLAVSLKKKDATIKASAGFSMEEHNLTIKPVTFDAPGTELNGEITANLDKTLIKGHLNGRIVDLSSLGRFLEEPMAGNGKIRVQFSPGKKGQDVALDLQAKALSVPNVKIRRLTLSADLQNVFDVPSGNANLKLKDFSTTDLNVDQLTFKASGNEKGMDFNGTVQGRSISRFDLQTGGTFTFASSGQKLRLQKLKGKFDKYAIELLRPLSLQMAQGSYSLDGLALVLGQGRIESSGHLDSKQVKFDANLEQIPLGLASIAGGPAISGSAGGRIHLAGPSSAPKAAIDLYLKDVRVSDPSLEDLPPVAVNASATLQQGVLNLDASLQGLTEKPAKASLETTAGFSLEPFDFSLPQNGKIKGHVDMEANLTKLTRFVPLDGQAISGKATADLDIGGQIDSPELNGFVTLENASYENFLTGTVLKDWDAKIAAAGQRLTIENFQATDGGNGTIKAKGTVDIEPEKHFPLDVNVTLADATLVRREDITGAIDGTVSVAGSVTDMKVDGNLQVSPVEVTLPDRLPPEMTDLKVIEVNGDGSEEGTKKEAKPTAESPLRLALNVKVNFPRRIFVRGWGLDSEWEGKLTVTGTAQKPSIVGSLSAVRGKVDFLNKRFDIVKGTITFYGASPPTPNLDITAESKVKEITARINFTGPADDPEMTLTSDPPLPSDEILAKVLFGRSATDITPSQALQLAMVARSLTGGGRGQMDFMSRTRKLLGLDELEFNSSEEGLSKGTLGIGKYLTEGVYLDIQKGVGEGTDKASVEVEVTPNITVESEVGSDSTSGIGVNWKYDY